jgi:GT2 family glycosyltransferase
MVTVFLSLITYNSHERTLACLDSLNSLTLDGISLKVFVIDNASNVLFSLDGKRYKHIAPKVIRSEKNAGFSGGHNIVLHKAIQESADYAMVLNNDVVVDADLLEILVLCAESDKNAAILCPKIYFEKGSEFHKERYKPGELGKVIWYAGGEMDWKNIIGHHRGVDEVDDGIYNTAEVTEFATGCCMLLRVSVLKKIGFLDERYFLYYEDADLSQRVKNAGYTILYEPKGVLWHANAGSTGGSGSHLQDYFISRNRLLFGMTYAPLRTKIALLKESSLLIRTGRKWQKVGVRDYFRRKFGKGSYHV